MKRIVVKIGTYSICDKNGVPSKEKISAIGTQVAKILRAGNQVILVSSGAVGAGASVMLNGKIPKTMALKQACAAIGQPILMSLYRQFFEFYNINVAQILLTSDVVKMRERFINARNTINTLLSKKILPIVNENDTVSIDEIKFGDNDNLAVNTAVISDSDICIILSDTDGLYKNYGTDSQERIKIVEKIDDKIRSFIIKKPGSLSTGGMESKINAAEKSIKMGIKFVILGSKTPDGLIRYLINNEDLGTTFVPEEKIASKKKWLFLITHNPKGQIYIDEGAFLALKNYKSLLPAGVLDISGSFKKGDAVRIIFNANEIGRGISKYSSEELKLIKKNPSSNIEKILGYTNGDEIIHRDDIIIA
ncbi:MAG TPA: glutamate 5-kinase [Spirochaetota bacterium]|nr:glutamate 5-kinase [Spirochaetota bacterium]HOM38338.1 glutamate 5-kinase [Spirochaetota bacterium]HPQ48444.1 glutamate 5-kinase [Spirochaetota bacterium]